MVSLLAMISAAALAGHAPARPAVASAPVGAVRVCAAAGYSESAALCRRSPKRPVLSGPVAACSIAGPRAALAHVKAEMTYRGAVVDAKTTALVVRGSKSMSVRVALGVPLPAGTWTCSFRGRYVHVRQTFRTTGRTGTLVDAGVCDDADAPAFTDDDPILCRPGADPRATTRFWLCSALVPAAKGATVEVHLVRDDADVVPPQRVAVRSPLTVVALADDGETQLEPGSYACRFTLGRTTVEVPFTAGAPA
jgi:hypothetical protein